MEEYKNHIDQALFEQIEAYLLNTMTPAERTRFEQTLATDRSLQKELELQRQLLAMVEVGSFQPQTATAATAPAATQAPVKRLFNWWWAAAALLILIAGLWYFQTNSISAQQLANQYFEPDPGLPVTMSSTRQYEFYDGMVSYKEADFDKAIAIWKAIEAKSGTTDTLQYYIGVAHLNEDQYIEALKQLLPVARGNGKWKEKASWYLSIAYLKLDQPEKAQKWLESIPQYPEANHLLNAVNQLTRQ